MVTRFREKIALAVFFGLIILGFCSLIGYLMLGYSWNVAATNIDDATGSLEGYTAIVYEGVAPQQPVDDELLPETEIEDQDLLSDGSSEDTANPNILYDEAISSLNAPDLSAQDVEKSYSEKSSSVVLLDVSDFNTYTDGLIFKKGNHRFGVFSVDKNTSKVEIRQTISYLEKHGVDFILAITTDKTLVEKYPSVDIVISTNPKDAISSGETAGNAFYVSTPTEGSVGIILISPSNVVSAKALNEI